ncbi:DUF4271 domain-containing protein [Hymenobacter coccineus]|uniref:DUF4271 domain-containing protein n=1 Tax=Hymenobacter coccineus TaxID=1908235 RepID=A0A1G1TMH3_9BACT|nr:DUF4271 domain-containing protein [Hymenobacter coccineus]OGX92025.1 hypothetical protein BEN49_17535 [Hymenobacter coccineus]
MQFHAAAMLRFVTGRVGLGRAWGKVWGLLLLLLGALPGRAAEYRPLPPAAPTGLTADWLIHDVGRNHLILYLPGYHSPAHAYYQYVRLRRGQPFPVAFAAQRGLSLFVDNQLIFTADQAGPYAFDLAQRLPGSLAPGTHLLGVWQPGGNPALASFTPGATTDEPDATPDTAAEVARARAPGPLGQNVLLSFLLVLGLLYGSVRATYQPGLARVFQFDELFGNTSEQGTFLARPAFSLLNVVLVLLFGLSFALLLTALHTGLENLPLVRQFVVVPERAIVARVLLYTALIAGFVLSKYLFISLLAYTFDLRELVAVQYREFLRTTLLAGLFLPFVLLLYLGLNGSYPAAVTGIAAAVIALVLVGTVLRVLHTVHQRASLLNLHLFAYLCATEILPLLILLRLLVFNT